MTKPSLFEQEAQLKQQIAFVIAELQKARRYEGGADVIAELTHQRERLMAQWKLKGEMIG